MDFNLKAHYNLNFHYPCYAIPEDTVDVEMTIQMVDGIYTYRRDQTTQMTSYSQWSRQVKPFSSPRKKIPDYKQEKKESCEKRNSNPFTPVRENKSGKKRSRKSQRSRKLDMGHSAPSAVASTWPMMTTTTSTASLSVPSDLPTTSNILSMPKPPAHRPHYKMWAIHHPTLVPLSSLVHSDWPSEEDWDGTKQKKRERISKLTRKENRKIAEEERRKKAEERALSCRSCVPVLNDEPNLSLTNLPAPAPEKKEKTQEKQKDHVTNYYPLVPYM